MTATPLVAVNVRGAVVIKADPDTARQLAEAWGRIHASERALDAQRPRWHDDMVTIVTAAANAEIEAGKIPDTVVVPFKRTGTES